MKARNNINFTHRVLDKLPLPAAGKRATYFDSKVNNLNVIVTDKGSKSFYVRKVINGQSKRIRLGVYPDLSVENARNMALDVKNAIAKGENPFEVQQKHKAELTLNDLFAVYMERHAVPHKKASSADADKENFRRHLKDAYGSRRLSTISQNDIARLHMKIGKERPYMANRILALTATIFSKAIEWKLFSGDNPASTVKPYKEKSRDRFLQPDEMPRFFEALDNEPNTDIRDYVLLSLFTGARKSNILSMRWDKLNLKEGLWRIEDTKNGEVLLLPLVDEAISILRERKKRADAKAVFVLASHGRTGHMVEPKKGWKRILERAGLENLRLHDLRRTLGSYQAINGTSLHIIGKSLGHKSLTATQIYSHLTDDPVRHSMGDAVKMMREYGGNNAS